MVLAVCLALVRPLPALAHGLDAQAFVLPGGLVQIEAWYTNGKPAEGARVKVFGNGVDVVAEGDMNEQGIFRFKPINAASWRIVVNAGGGHQKELSLSSRDLSTAPANETELDSTSKSRNSSLRVLADRTSRESIGNVLLGLALLLSVAAFWLSLRNAKKLRSLESRS